MLFKKMKEQIAEAHKINYERYSQLLDEIVKEYLYYANNNEDKRNKLKPIFDHYVCRLSLSHAKACKSNRKKTIDHYTDMMDIDYFGWGFMVNRTLNI